MPEKPELSTEEWTVYRDGPSIDIRNKKSRKSYSKTYGSDHAAVCAIARMRHDERMIGTIAGKIASDELSGRSSVNPPKPRLTAEHVLAVCWKQMSPRARIKVENEIIDATEKGIDTTDAKALVKRLNEDLGE